MATVPPAPTLPCKECGYVNEPERVYCHSCGAKLDRSILPKEDQIRRETPDHARKRIMRMTNPDRNLLKSIVSPLLKTLIYASIVAALVLAARAPADAPPEKPELSQRLVSSEVTQLMDSPQPKQTTFRENEINAFLASGKVKKDSSLPGVSYVRSFVNLGDGVGRITTERNVVSWPVYVGALYRMEADRGVFFAENAGGNIGRLPIHPLLMRYAAPYLFGDLAKALKPELDAVRKAFYLRIEKTEGDKRVTLATAGLKR